MKNQIIIVISIIILMFASVLFLGIIENQQKTGKSSQGWWSVYFLSPYEKESLNFVIENYDKNETKFSYEIISVEKVLEKNEVQVNFQEVKKIEPKISNNEGKPVEIIIYSNGEKSDKKSLTRK